MYRRHEIKRGKSSPARARRGRRFSAVCVAAATLLGVVGAVAVDAAPSGASVVTWDGQLNILQQPPPTVSNSALQSNSLINFFQERSDYTLPSQLPVDITPNGTFPIEYKGNSPTLSPSTLAAGTDVDSYFMFSNPVGTPTQLFDYDAEITFSAPILGVIFKSASLIATDSTVGAPGTVFNLNALAGFEDPGDTVELINATTMFVSMTTSADIDSLRVVTAPTPSTSPGGGQTIPTPGYTMVASDGGIFNYGSGSGFYGSMGGQPLNAPMVGGAQVAGQPGYWTVAADGGVFSFGAAQFYGSMGGKHLNAPIVGMASTPDGLGYWFVASDGGIFNYGDAGYFGSRGGRKLNAPIVGMASTPDGGGYWLVASDGGVFSYGDAQFLGSMGGIPLNKPIVGIASTPDGHGYWMVASDGGIFSFGDAAFYGSMGGQPLNQPMVGIVPTGDGLGYWTVAADGGVFSYGDATFLGSMGGTPLNKPIVGAF
jgi:hypothetical protein